jgi:exodeoxyribonuclease V beta subunit
LVRQAAGAAGAPDSRARLVEDLDDLVKETVDDLYLRAFAFDVNGPAFSHTEALAIARDVVRDRHAGLAPSDAEAATPAGRKVRFAETVRSELDRRKRRLGILSYDDLLSQLADALADADGPAAQRMRQRWSIVLVDEFQDTDPVQWQVLDRAFSGHATMVLIGDPKQAIYAFRGGDVTTYLKAADTAAVKQTLSVNWRSDQPLLDSFQRLLGGAALGDDRIVVRDVEAHHGESRLMGAPASAPFRVRVVRRETFGRRDNSNLTARQVRAHVAEDLAIDVRRLLNSQATFDGQKIRRRDIAVLCHKHDHLAQVQAELLKQGVPAVIAGGGSVFATPAAIEWLTLLEALEQPHRSARVRSAALTCFLGHTAEELDARGDDLTDEVAEILRAWVELFTTRGVAAVIEAANVAGLPERVLAEVGGDRRLTDLRQIGEALHEVTLAERHGPVSLLTWLRAEVSDGRSGRGAERTRRLDSDAAAVQLVTIHASKGLEYPVVYLPTLGDRFVRAPERPRFHDDDGERRINVGGGGSGWADDCRRYADEEAGESLRLLYVAITRAKSQVVCWWAPTKNAVASPLHRMLMRDIDSAEVPESPAVPDDDAVIPLFASWRDRGGPSPEPAIPAAPGADPPAPTPPALAARSFTREVDTEWRRASYSSLSKVEVPTGPAGAVASEPEVSGKDDEGLEPVVEEIAAPLAGDVPSPMAALPVGATFGSLVHAVLEHTDPDAPDLRAELLGHIDEQLGWWPVELDREELADALIAVCDSPLGPLVGRTLREVPLTDRLREMDFELPLAGGDLATDVTDTRLGDLAPLLERHLQEGDPVRGYAAALAGPLGEQTLRGYLTGSVDVVLRVHSDAGPRYLIVDYKTNWLGPMDQPLTAHSYRPQALAGAMGHSDYPLQALLYAAVLHRFLRWRQPGYDPAVHLGGVLYLYLRGMCGPETPLIDGSPCGVFAWQPPVALVEALSDLLDGAR